MMSRMIGRRPALRAVAAMAAAGAGLGRGGVARAEEQVPYSSGTERPELKAPANACDCHMHIYDSRFPVAADATLRPPDAHVDDYRRLQRRLGTTRNVVVTPSTYGTDNRCTLDALGQLGAGARGVAVVDTSVADDELKRLADQGVRGIRFNLVQAGATTVDMLEPLARRVEPLGWHVQIHMLGDQIAQTGDLLARLPAPVVFDHLGRIPQPAGEQHPAYRVIRGLLDQGRAWVKLSGAYMDSRSDRPTPTRPRSPRPTSRQRRSGWSGAATGRTRPCRSTRSPTTRSSSTSWPSGRRTRRPASGSWSGTPRSSTASRSRPDTAGSNGDFVSGQPQALGARRGSG